MAYDHADRNQAARGQKQLFVTDRFRVFWLAS